MKTRLWVGSLLGAAALTACGESNLVINSFQRNGLLRWTYPTNVGATTHRVEWAAQAAGPWYTFSDAATSLDAIAPTGVTMSAVVPLFYRVVATEPAINPPYLLVDDYEGLDNDRDITDVFRTPTIGPSNSVAWYEGHGNSQAKAVLYLDGMCAKVHVPSNAALDYIAHLGTPCGGAPFLLTWDLEAESVNGGGGMFFVRFPHAVNGMQILFGFLDDGRVIRFFDVPATNTFVTIGTWQAQTRYRICLIYDLAAATYSVLFDGVWIVNHEPIPGYLATNVIAQVGFDVNQTMGLPGKPAKGNSYHIDNVRFGRLAGHH